MKRLDIAIEDVANQLFLHIGRDYKQGMSQLERALVNFTWRKRTRQRKRTGSVLPLAHGQRDPLARLGFDVRPYRIALNALLKVAANRVEHIVDEVLGRIQVALLCVLH